MNEGFALHTRRESKVAHCDMGLMFKERDVWKRTL